IERSDNVQVIGELFAGIHVVDGLLGFLIRAQVADVGGVYAEVQRGLVAPCQVAVCLGRRIKKTCVVVSTGLLQNVWYLRRVRNFVDKVFDLTLKAFLSFVKFIRFFFLVAGRLAAAQQKNHRRGGKQNAEISCYFHRENGVYGVQVGRMTRRQPPFF